MIRLRADSARLRRSIRQREIEAVFRHVADDAFEEALELGGGDGAQSRLLARYTGEALGISSCTGFAFVKRGRSPAGARWLTSERP